MNYGQGNKLQDEINPTGSNEEWLSVDWFITTFWFFVIWFIFSLLSN